MRTGFSQTALKTRLWFGLCLGVLFACCSYPAVTAEARVQLVALPDRGETIIRLDNPQATLIEEERVLTFQQGLNQVDFSWKGVSIDPDSIRLRPLSHPEQVSLLNVSFPPGEASLVWEIYSHGAWEEKVRISYLLSNIDRLITYKLVANKEEDRADFKSFLILRNFSGEDFPRARIVLDYGEAFERGIAHEETKQMLLLKPGEVVIRKIWTFDTGLLPWNPDQVQDNVGIPVSYRIMNFEKNGMGGQALWGGKVRVFQQDGYGGSIFLGEDQTPFVPPGARMEVAIGESRDIVVTQRKMKETKLNVRRNSDNQIVLYDSDEVIEAAIENFKDKAARLTLIEHIAGQWEMKECNLKYDRENAGTIKFQIDLPPRGKKVLTMRYQRRNIRP